MQVEKSTEELQLEALGVAYGDLEIEYASLDEAFGELEAEKNRFVAEYDRLREQLKWTHAMLSILLEEQGGVVQVSKSILESYDTHTSAIKVYEDIESQTYIIEVDVEEDAEVPD